jgi:hypothetical protein
MTTFHDVNQKFPVSTLLRSLSIVALATVAFSACQKSEPVNPSSASGNSSGASSGACKPSPGFSDDYGYGPNVDSGGCDVTAAQALAAQAKLQLITASSPVTAANFFTATSFDDKYDTCNVSLNSVPRALTSTTANNQGCVATLTKVNGAPAVTDASGNVISTNASASTNVALKNTCSGLTDANLISLAHSASIGTCYLAQGNTNWGPSCPVDGGGDGTDSPIGGAYYFLFQYNFNSSYYPDSVQGWPLLLGFDIDNRYGSYLVGTKQPACHTLSVYELNALPYGAFDGCEEDLNAAKTAIAQKLRTAINNGQCGF